MIGAATERQDVRWKWALLGLCSVALFVTISAFADGLGLGGRAWYGFWDANVAPSDLPYVIKIKGPRTGGASERAGLRDGDRIDLREQNLQARIAALYQLPATQPTSLIVRRGGATLPITVMGSTAWEGAPLWKLPVLLFPCLAALWFTVCVLVIGLRRWWSREAQILVLVLVALAANVINPIQFTVPWGRLAIALLVISRFCMAAAPWLLVLLSSRFGRRSSLRTALETAAYVAIAVGFVADLAAASGILFLRWDPTPVIFRVGAWRSVLDVISWSLVVLVASVAVGSTPEDQRPRAAWLLLPLPLALLLSAVVSAFAYGINSWYGNIAVFVISSGVVFFGALVVTYALLKRRVLDLEFVLGRTLVVASISLAIVAAFALLEWLLGTVLAGVSHATGLIANAALALVLGLSLNPLHKRADVLVDTFLFRKRHEDERALLAFSKEAGYVTQSDALLDRAIEVLNRHTDARSAALLIEHQGGYHTARSFGETCPHVDENDAAILALKTWHRPIDPHRYNGALRGALALPMVVRGRLLGVVLLGERSGGEAYAPDEVEALSQFAQGVGSAVDVIAARQDSSDSAVLAGIKAVLKRLDTIAESLGGH